MPISDLQRTDIHIAGLLGGIEEHESHFVVRTPENPGFFFGNYIVLKRKPSQIKPWLDAFDSAFGTKIDHRLIAWGGSSLDEGLLAEAKRLGMNPDSAAELSMHASPPAGPVPAGWKCRRLDPSIDWDASVKLDIASNVTEMSGSDQFRKFREAVRATRLKWIQQDLATWWGVFADEVLIAQCGIVHCQELGRYQAVETHPDWRRQGACSLLINTVARATLSDPGIDRLLLAAEVEGPALALYKRLGFVETGQDHALLGHDWPLTVRPEEPGDDADVRSLLRAALSKQQASKLAEYKRDAPGAFAVIAEKAGRTLGHALFVPHSDSKISAVELICVAIKPSAQRSGVATTLVQSALRLCGDAGHELCLVAADMPGLARFGFEAPSSPRLRELGFLTQGLTAPQEKNC